MYNWPFRYHLRGRAIRPDLSLTSPSLYFLLLRPEAAGTVAGPPLGVLPNRIL
jgi:hypothetical protein